MDCQHIRKRGVTLDSVDKVAISQISGADAGLVDVASAATTTTLHPLGRHSWVRCEVVVRNNIEVEILSTAGSSGHVNDLQRVWQKSLGGRCNGAGYMHHHALRIGTLLQGGGRHAPRNCEHLRGEGRVRATTVMLSPLLSILQVIVFLCPEGDDPGG